MAKENLSCKIEPEAKKILEQLAEKEKCTLSKYVKAILLTHIKDKGVDIKKYQKSIQLDLF
ncbi:MAG: hypothetical protein MUE70_11040 [Desulfobacterales bacterium]|jgi:replication initiation and membrane attachment protein DnaB|nr:hypothetical protein [Desulfobacterales bacterium]